MDPKLAGGYVRQDVRNLSRAQERWPDIAHAAVDVGTYYFARGRRLQGDSMPRLVETLNEKASEILKPVLAFHRQRAATRGRPKSEASEMLYAFASPVPRDDTDDCNRYALCTLRIFVTRKKLELNMRSVGIEVTEHAARRGMERGTIEAGMVADIFRTITSNAGMVSPAIDLISRRPGTRGRLAIPCNDGLLMAEMRPRTDGLDIESAVPSDWSLVCDVVGVRSEDVEPAIDPLLSIRTAIGPSEMAPGQIDYHSRMEQWTARHVQALWSMSRAVLWPDAILDGARGLLTALDPDRQRAVGDLHQIIAKPAMFRAMGNMPIYPQEAPFALSGMQGASGSTVSAAVIGVGGLDDVEASDPELEDQPERALRFG